jgi:RNA ligase (TIGR02306 family)
VDSVVPETKPFAFLAEHRRITTRKFKKALSQGIVLPIEEFAEDLSKAGLLELAVGDDLTAVLGIKKYQKDIPATMQGLIRGNFPSFIPKTDEENIQSCKRILDELKGIPVYVTVKCDGSSATYAYHDDHFYACSRNWEKEKPVEGTDKKDVFWDMAIKYGLEEKLKEMPDIAIQAELVGPTVCGNHMGLTELKLLVFDAFNIKTQKYLGFGNLLEVCHTLGLEMVPVLEPTTYIPNDELKDIDSLLKYADGEYSPGFIREGIVVRPIQTMESDTLRGRSSFKVVSREYLLKYKE